MTEPVTQTKVNSLAISMLKNLKNLEELSFEGSELTAIMGPNGCGKTTILLLQHVATSHSKASQDLIGSSASSLRLQQIHAGVTAILH